MGAGDECLSWWDGGGCQNQWATRSVAPNGMAHRNIARTEHDGDKVESVVGSSMGSVGVVDGVVDLG